MNTEVTPGDLEHQGRVLQEMAREVVAAADSTAKDWEEIYWDHRQDGDSGSGTERIVARTPTGRVWIPGNVNVYNPRDTLLDLRSPSTGYWYGIFIHIKRSGEVDVKYDYDPDCIETFFDDEDNHVPF